MTKCKHDEKLLSVKDVAKIFDKSYKTILMWVKTETFDTTKTEVKYKYGKFINAFKCIECNRIFIPVSDVETVLEEMREKLIEGS